MCLIVKYYMGYKLLVMREDSEGWKFFIHFQLLATFQLNVNFFSIWGGKYDGVKYLQNSQIFEIFVTLKNPVSKEQLAG